MDFEFPEYMNPLAQHLYEMIAVTGSSLTIAEYMNFCLLHPLYGYYTTKPTVLGRGGDFVTAPELTSIFSELVCIWCIGLWQLQGDPKAIRLVEMGPGKGTLMRDALRAAEVLPAFHDAVRSGGVHLVEASPTLRRKQCETLLEEFGGRVIYAEGRNEGSGEGGAAAEASTDPTASKELPAALELDNGIRVTWYRDPLRVPEGPMYFIGHELLDALPVHQLIRVNDSWRERLVEPNIGDAVEFRASVIKRPGGLSEAPEAPADRMPGPDEDQFRVVAGEHPTEGLTAILDIPESELRPGLVVEVCPAALKLAQDIAKRIAESGGAAILIDYGGEGLPRESLRGFADNREVSWLKSPGQCDMTADVDFSAVKRAVGEVPGVAAVGCVSQAAFLGAMGIRERAMALMNQEGFSDEDKEKLYQVFIRLVGDDQMGQKYKVMGIVPEGVKHVVPGISPEVPH